MSVAITRGVSPSINRCELVHLARVPIDVLRAHAQHRGYEAALGGLGLEVLSLPADPALPDSVFVEDTAVVLDEVAVLLRPGAASRRPETEPIARALAPHRPLVRVEAPATVDGGDVLRIGRTLYVGQSSRSGPTAVEQLGALLAPFGYAVVGVSIRGCLHLKSAATPIAEDRLLVNPAFVDPAAFGVTGILEVDPSEPAAANALRLGDALLYSTSHPRTRARLEQAGFRVVPVEVSELEKAEGAVTCCSLIVAA